MAFTAIAARRRRSALEERQRGGAATSYEEQIYQRSVAHRAGLQAEVRDRSMTRSGGRSSSCRRRTSCISSRSRRRGSSRGSARSCASCANRAIFLSAEADQDDERGLRHLRAITDHDHAHERGLITEGAFLEFLQSTPMSSSSRSSTIRAIRRHQPLCPRLRDDERHRAHLRSSRPRRTAAGSREIAGNGDS